MAGIQILRPLPRFLKSFLQIKKAFYEKLDTPMESIFNFSKSKISSGYDFPSGFDLSFSILFGGFVFCLVATFQVGRPAEMLPSTSGTFINIFLEFL